MMKKEEGNNSGYAICVINEKKTKLLVKEIKGVEKRPLKNTTKQGGLLCLLSIPHREKSKAGKERRKNIRLSMYSASTE